MRRLPGLLALLALGGGLVALAIVALGGPAEPPPLRAGGSVAAALAGDPAGFARAERPRPFDFPADHGPHPSFRTEWWYFTGNLATAEGRRLGYQLTFFRQALAPPPPAQRASAWAADQAWMAHFAVTDAGRATHRAAERLARGALGLAGAEAEPFRVWVEGWEAAAPAGEPSARLAPVRLRAADGEMALDLELVAGRPPLLHGDRGLSPKGRAPGNASHYYSIPRFATRGTIHLGGEELTVAGSSWLDREWGTSLLERGQEGWDWLSLQLSDGSDLMLFRLRGEGDAGFADGTLSRPGETPRRLREGDFDLEARRVWRSPTGAAYPVGWRLRIPNEGVDLVVEPLVDEQEMNLSFRYWEGAMTAEGRSGGRAVTGRGYLELVGY